ncbi:hypothetical protein EYR40_000013 [Pleurotus pulmonarius]|nr:hypothetical protein EYR40_000013 [Pleurotus pulmonarius]
MPDLPQDILTCIVEVVSDPKTLWALLTVSRHISGVAILAIYGELSIDSRNSTEYINRVPKYILTLQKLARTARSNRNLRLTTSFTFFGFDPHDVQDTFAQAILPRLSNLRRLEINTPHIDPKTLWLLPRRVKLTHLILYTVTYSKHFIRFLDSQPNLRLLSVSMFQKPPVPGSTEQPLPPAIPLSPSALPQLRSLEAPTRAIPQFSHRDTVVDLTFTSNAWGERNAPFPIEVRDALVTGFRSVRGVYFPHPIDFEGIAFVIRELPNLQYFGMDTSAIAFPLPWHLLAATPLKYIQFGDILQLDFAAEIAADVFNSIPSVDVLDVYQDGYGERRVFQRFCRHAPEGISAQIYRTQWQVWWEPVAREIHEICANH